MKKLDVEKKENEEKAKLGVGLISIEKRNTETLNKVLIFATLAVVVVSASLIAGIFINKLSKKENEHQDVATVEPTPEPTPEPKLPKYSDEAKEKINNIYSFKEEKKDENTGEVIGEEKVVYLTFDDGPSKTVTPQILDILRNEGVKATFFVLGSRVELYPELVKQEYEEGHFIANHGYSHNYSSIYNSKEAVLDEYNNTERKIKDALGMEEYSSHLFRFPGGSVGGKYKKVKNEAKELLEENSVLHIDWNCLTNDSVGKPTYESLIKDFKLTQNR